MKRTYVFILIVRAFRFEYLPCCTRTIKKKQTRKFVNVSDATTRYNKESLKNVTKISAEISFNYDRSDELTTKMRVAYIYTVSNILRTTTAPVFPNILTTNTFSNKSTGRCPLSRGLLNRATRFPEYETRRSNVIFGYPAGVYYARRSIRPFERQIFKQRSGGNVRAETVTL